MLEPGNESTQDETRSPSDFDNGNTSHSRKLRPYHGRLVQAFAQHGSVAAVARVSGVSLPTVWRWLKVPANKAEVEAARRDVHQALSIFQGALPVAATTLLRVARDGAQTKEDQITVRAAEVILKGHEALRKVHLFDQRIADLEAKVQATKGKRA